ncbi:MAG: hypothetical protein ACTSWP_00955 [Candidatus Freyarchaeota archaeon]|nr:hypothetical protein [Candidatus Freyrarchaeum guaymaensis]
MSWLFLLQEYKCYICGKETKEICEDCGRPVCTEHSTSCEYCGRRICLNCDY